MRALVASLLLLGVAVPFRCPACSAAQLPDEQTLAALEQRAAQAPAKYQCYLYADLVHQTVEYSAHQYAAGDLDEATKTLKRTQQYTDKIRMMLTGNVKRLKLAEILLQRTAFRLTDLLHVSNYADRQLLHDTLADVQRTQEEALQHMFREDTN